MLKRIALPLCFVLVLSALLLSNMVSAKTKIDDKGAAELKALFQGFIDEQRQAQEAKGQKLNTEGEILVEQAEDYYAVTLPAMTYAASDGSTIKIGLIAVNASPTEKKDEWKMAISLPTPFILSNAKGEEMHLNIGKQKAGGIWSKELQSFSTLAAIYDNISVAPPEGNEILSIEQLVSQNKYELGKDGKWSGFGKSTAKNMKIDGGSKSDFMASIASISANIDMEDYDPAKMETVQDKLAAKAEQVEKLQQNPQENAQALQKEGLTLASMAFDALLKSLNKSTMTFSIQDMNVSGTNKKTAQKETVKLDSILFNLGMDNLQDNDGKMNALFSIAFEGLDMQPPKPHAEVDPHQIQDPVGRSMTYRLEKVTTLLKENPNAKKDPGGTSPAYAAF